MLKNLIALAGGDPVSEHPFMVCSWKTDGGARFPHDTAREAKEEMLRFRDGNNPFAYIRPEACVYDKYAKWLTEEWAGAPMEGGPPLSWEEQLVYKMWWKHRPKDRMPPGEEVPAWARGGE